MKNNENQSKMSKEERQRQMFDWVELWQQSGLNRRAFSRKHGIKSTTLDYWVKKHRALTERQALLSEFVELKPPGGDTSIVIRYSNGTEISLPPQTPLKSLKFLLKI